MDLWIRARISENSIPRVVSISIEMIELWDKVAPTTAGKLGSKNTFVTKTDGMW